MEKLLELYSNALQAYSEQIKNLEVKKKETQTKHHIAWIPHNVLNSRMFAYDEHLLNNYYNGFCFEEKKSVMPHLLAFIASYEKFSENDKSTFEKSKPKNEYHEYFDELYLGKKSFIDFLELQLAGLKESEGKLKVPHRPTKSNATRQLAQYREDIEELKKKLTV